MSRRFALLVNPAAARGGTLKALPAVTAAFDRLGATYRTVTTRSIEHAGEEAAIAAGAGETVAAMGGDGLLRPLAGALRHSESAIALIPAGRGNDFARTLGIPSDPVEAVKVAVDGTERLVDVAEVDGTPFVGIASLGFDSEANRIANEARMVKGEAVYIYAALRALAAWKHAHFVVSVDGQQHEVIGFGVAVGNAKAYGGGMLLLPHAEVDDGVLDLMLVGRYPKLAFLRNFPKLFKGTHIPSPYCTLLTGTEVRVSSDRPFVVYADGDPIGATPASIRVTPRCLRMIVPT